jgi:hypothetical protein
MGTAFSSSLFGLTGSLVVGFLDLQASQAQNRFYTELRTGCRPSPTFVDDIEVAGAAEATVELRRAVDRLAAIMEGAEPAATRPPLRRSSSSRRGSANS